MQDGAFSFFLWLLWFPVVGGGLGGLTSAIAELTGMTDGHNQKQGVSVWAFVGAKILLGIAGAVAILLLTLGVSGDLKVERAGDALRIAAICFVAGSIGQQILDLAASQLKKQVAEANRKSEEAVKTAGLALKSDELGLDLAKALRILGGERQSKEVVTTLRKSLEAHSANFPLHRELHIFIGRFFAELEKDYKKAYSILEGYSSRLEAEPAKLRNNDIATAYWNRGCYAAQLTKSTSGVERADWLKKAISDLKTSIGYEPSFESEIRGEIDFDAISNETEFKEAFR